MLVKITCKAGYGDRYGVLHGFGEVADLPAAIAAKVILHRFGVAVEVEPAPEPPAEVEEIAPALDEEDATEVETEPEPEPAPVKRSPGRPRKAE